MHINSGLGFINVRPIFDLGLYGYESLTTGMHTHVISIHWLFAGLEILQS